MKDQKYFVWVEEGLVIEKGIIILFLIYFRGGGSVIRIWLGSIKSYDNGVTWLVYEILDGDFIGYFCFMVVVGEINYIMVDSTVGFYVLYVSRDDGCSWSKWSVMSLDDDKWYGIMIIMVDGWLMGGVYIEKDE